MTSSVPRVSVVIPNYNHARFLDRRIGSVLGQTLSDIEVLLLDDASTDESLSVFARYAGDTRVRTVLNASNSGSPFAQWNRGVSEARGEYVWIAESDDWADPRLLETLARRLDENPDAGIAYCESWVVYEDVQDVLVRWTETQMAHHFSLERWKSDFVSHGSEECLRYLSFTNMIPNASAVLFRKSLFDQVGGANATMRSVGDWHLWLRMLAISDLVFVSDPLNYFRQHPTSVTPTSRYNGRAIAENFEVLCYLLNQTDMPPQVVRSRSGGMRTFWFNVLLSSENRIPWMQNLRILRLASGIDPNIVPAFLQACVILFIRGIGLDPSYQKMKKISQNLFRRCQAPGRDR